MNIKNYLKKNAPKIDDLIKNLIPRKIDKKSMEHMAGKARYAYDLDTLTKSLSEPIWDFLDRGGKRWRPTLMLLMIEAFGGDKEKHKDFATIVELVHEGTIMVDDIEDDSDLRRGKKAIHKIFGNDIAINTGNAMYFLPSVIIKKSDFSEKKKNDLYETYLQEMINVSIGQALDIQWHKEETIPSEKEYLQMCAFKTGCLARMATKMGALLADASEEKVKKVGKWAEAVGIGFQIQDDILNIAPTEKWGKDTSDDINEGKKTLLVIKALEELNKKDSEKLKKILSKHTENEKEIKKAIGLIKKTNAINYCKKIAEDMVKKAWKKLEPELQEGKAKNLIKKFSMFLVDRDI